MKLPSKLLTFTLAATAAASLSPATTDALNSRQISLPPRCPDTYPAVQSCRKAQTDECIDRPTHPVCWPERNTPQACFDFCSAGAVTLCALNCYRERPNQDPPFEHTPGPEDCAPERPEYIECYNEGMEWCMTKPLIERLYCNGDCPGYCHEWMGNACRKACAV